MITYLERERQNVFVEVEELETYILSPTHTLGVAKYSATTADSAVSPTVAKSVVVARPPRVAKYSATTAFPVVAQTVAKSVGVAEARPPAMYRATTEFRTREVFFF